MVLGHEGCGAVTAALDAKFKQAKEPKYIEAVVKMIEPGLKNLDAKLTGPDQLNAAIEANVRGRCARSPNCRRAKRRRRRGVLRWSAPCTS